MRWFEKGFAILNIIFIFVYLFTFNADPGINPISLFYISIFGWLMVMNWLYEGFKL